MTNDVDTLGQSLDQSVTQLITSVTQIIGVAVMMVSVSVTLAGLTFLTVPVSLRCPWWSSCARRSGISAVSRPSWAAWTASSRKASSGQNVIKVFNREQRAVADFDVENANLYDSGWRAQFFSGLMQPIMNFVANLAYVAVVIVGAFLAIASTINLGDIQAFMQLSAQLHAAHHAA